MNWNGANVVVYPCNPSDGTPNSSSSCVGGSRTTVSKVATQPKYIVERMGPVDSSTPNTIAYRITARGTGSSNAAVVMLQSTYVRTF